MSQKEREEAEPRKWRLEEEARSWAVGAEGGTDEMEWRRRRGAGLLVLEAELTKWSGGGGEELGC